MSNRVRDLYTRPLPENPCWISGGVLPKGGIMLAGGAAKIGKTFLLLDLAHALATGGRVWGMMEWKIPEPTTVLYAEQEVGEMELQRRVKMRYDTLKQLPPDGFYYTSRLRDFFLDTVRGKAVLEEQIRACGAKVVIVDPISRCMLGDENDNTEVGRLFKFLDELLTEFEDLSIVLAHHFGKPPKEEDGTDPLSPYNFRGASKWFDAPDTLVTFRRLMEHPGEWRRVQGAMEIRQGANPEKAFNLIVEPGGIVQPAPLSGALMKAGWKR